MFHNVSHFIFENILYILYWFHQNGGFVKKIGLLPGMLDDRIPTATKLTATSLS